MKKRLRILSVVGTRPEAIKMAPLLINMQKEPDKFDSIVCITAQHREMLDQVIKIFGFKHHYDFNIMTINQNLSCLAARVLSGLKEIFEKTNPDLVLVQGDTTTTFASALAAFYHQIPIAHVEAGLRTGDLYNPFPEEANRVLTDRLSSYFFAPTEQNRQNLLNEGIPKERIFVTGNTVIDALVMIRDQISNISSNTWSRIWGSAKEVILHPEKLLILVTAHRRENFGKGLHSIFQAIRELAQSHPNWSFVYPVHLNPNVQKPAYAMLSELQNVYLIQPLDYLPFVYLMNRCDLILTDSGGIQEEAISLGKPVLVLREKTERTEAIQVGSAMLVGTDKVKIKNAIENIIENGKFYCKIKEMPNPYGDGLASKRILKILKKEFGIL